MSITREECYDFSHDPNLDVDPGILLQDLLTVQQNSR